MVKRLALGLCLLFGAITPMWAASPAAPDIFSGELAKLDQLALRQTFLTFLADKRSTSFLDGLVAGSPPDRQNQIRQVINGTNHVAYLMTFDLKRQEIVDSMLRSLAAKTASESLPLTRQLVQRLETRLRPDLPFSLYSSALVRGLLQSLRHELLQSRAELAANPSLESLLCNAISRLDTLVGRLEKAVGKDYHATILKALEAKRCEIRADWFDGGPDDFEIAVEDPISTIKAPSVEAPPASIEASPGPSPVPAQNSTSAIGNAGYGSSAPPSTPTPTPATSGGLSNSSPSGKKPLPAFNLPPIRQSRPNFLWGVSTSGYQWEGGITTNQWVPLEQAGKYPTPCGKAANGRELYGKDVELAKGLGCNAFRVSIEWARIEPQRGHIDPEAVAWYHDLFKEMRARGITPLVTLMHFSYPQWLQDQFHGWENPLAVPEFIRFVDFVSKEYAEDVDWWLTFNEPTVYLLGVYLTGQTAPGSRNKLAGVMAALNFIEAHKQAYVTIHRNDPVAQVSFNTYINVLNFNDLVTVSFADSPPLSKAAPDQAYDLKGDWMLQGLARGKGQDKGQGGGMYLDYIGIDYYCRWPVPYVWREAWDWEIYPEGLYPTLRAYYRSFGLPIVIAENGMSTRDLAPRADGWTREAFLVQHVKEVQRAVADGIPVAGFFVWSITDNWEFGSFSPRFGLYAVDCKNEQFERVPTPSATVYRQIIKHSGVNAKMLGRFPAPAKPAAPPAPTNPGQGKDQSQVLGVFH